MDRLKRYNQKLLAVLGTLAVVILTGIVLTGVGVILSELLSGFGSHRAQDNALAVAPQQDSVDTSEVTYRDQALTFGMPRLIDTVAALYLIPLSQVNLKSTEKVRGRTEKLLDLSSGGKYYNHSGYFNNLLIYDQQNKTRREVFDRKVMISAFQHRMVLDQLYLFIEGSHQDTNQNGKLDHDDLKSFFVYRLSDQTLSEFTFEGMGLQNYYLTHLSGELLLRYAMDKNNNGEIDSDREPSVIKSLDLSSFSIKDFLDEQHLDRLQQLID